MSAHGSVVNDRSRPFIVTCPIRNAEGHQRWRVTATSEREAIDNFRAGGGEFVDEEVEVTSLDRDNCEASEDVNRTLDGVPITDGMDLFYLYELKGRCWANPPQRGTDPRLCYSSREAALKAGEARGWEARR